MDVLLTLSVHSSRNFRLLVRIPNISVRKYKAFYVRLTGSFGSVDTNMPINQRKNTHVSSRCTRFNR
jgi:hypothetical protein